MSDFAEKVEQLKYADRQSDTYRLNLDEAQNGFCQMLVGETLHVVAASSATAAATVRLNTPDGTPHTLKSGTKLKGVFIRAFFTSDAQPGEWLDIVTGIDFAVDQATQYPTTQPCQVITNATADTNTTGSNKACSQRVMVRSKPDNAGIAWVNIDTAAAAGSCWPLAVGDGLELSLNNLNQINVLFESGGDKVMVFHEK